MFIHHSVLLLAESGLFAAHAWFLAAHARFSSGQVHRIGLLLSIDLLVLPALLLGGLAQLQSLAATILGLHGEVSHLQGLQALVHDVDVVVEARLKENSVANVNVRQGAEFVH